MNVTPVAKHPAKFSAPILALMGRLVDEETARVGHRLRLLDPFAGVGRVHDLNADTVGVELEAEWAACRVGTVVGDSRELATMFTPASFDAMVVSPTYGNRMADHHEARDGSRRRSYRHDLGRPLTAGNSGAMGWGDAYRELHEAVWAQCSLVLRPGALALVNVSNHVRRKQVVPVVEWHVGALRRAGFVLEEMYAVPTKRLRDGENAEARVPHEHVLVLRNAG